MKKSAYLILLILLFSIIQVMAQKNNNPISENPVISFGLISDVQYCNCLPGGERYYNNSLQKLNDCVNNFNKNHLDFVVNLGDLIDRDFTSYENIFNIFATLQAPINHVLGNHDFAVEKKRKSEINKKFGLKKRYYSKKIANYRFIFLDGNDISLYSKSKLNYKTWKAARIFRKLKRDGELNATNWNGGIGLKQKMWLDKTLKLSNKEGEKVIIFCHFPIGREGSIYNLWNHLELKEIIKKHNNIIAYISGHDHKGEYNYVEGVHYLTLKGMVETANTNAYAIIEIYSDHIELKGFGREEDRELTIDN